MESEAQKEGRCGYRVVGRVQGVGFRWWARRQARELGLGGWVRNEADGSVVVHAVGPTDALDRLAAALHEGPSAARVQRVEAIPPAGPLTPGDFRVET
jgi:acylphosphatase